MRPERGLDSPAGEDATGWVSWSLSSSGIRIDARGDLCACHRDDLRSAVRAASKHQAPVVVDMAAVTRVGDTGLAFLTRLAATELRFDRRLALLDPPVAVLRFLGARKAARLFELG